MKSPNYTIKDIANELNITREWLHHCIKDYKILFKAPGNMKTAQKKFKYSEEEKNLIINLFRNSKVKRRNK